MSNLKKLQFELGEMQATVSQLQELEDYDGADYSEVIQDTRWLHVQLRHRLSSLQMRKR